MKLIYNSVDLATLGTLRILGHQAVREPAESPNRARVTLRVRLDFFAQTYRDNHGLIDQFRAAVKRQQLSLLWQDDSETKFLERTVTIGDDETVEEPLAKGGTYWQAITFSFWYLDHDVESNNLTATYQRSAQTTALTLGQVEAWKEALQVARFEELQDARRLVTGTIEASGRFHGDTTLSLDAGRAALLALKDQWTTEILAASSGTFTYGTFNRAVRVTAFTCEVNQPKNYIAWSFSATFTAYPNALDYVLLEYRLTARENWAEGIPYTLLAGRIRAVSLTAAQNRLALLKAAVAPAGYVTVDEETEQSHGQSARISGASLSAAESAFLEYSFAISYRDPATRVCSYQRTGVSTPVVDLGTVDKYRDSYSATLFDDLRPHRKRAGGQLALAGAWYVADSLSDAEQVTALLAKKAALEVELPKGSSGTFIYGDAFNGTVRVLEFHADVNRAKHRVEWSATFGFTRYPNESDYALCEFNLGSRENRAEGTVFKLLNGRIGAPTPEAARDKLARLRTALIPAGYTLVADNTEERRVDVESGRAGGNDTGDGASFIELTIADEWQQTSGDVLSWRLRVTTDDDAKTGWVRVTYSGSVQASASTTTGALATARAKAAALGDNKAAFKVRSTVVENSFQMLASGSVVLGVDFSYEYQSKGERIYTEVTAELAADSFGRNVETISGMIAAPSLALALATYNADVRAAYAGRLILSERRPTLSEQRLDDQLNRLATEHDRFSFSLVVHADKAATATAIQYTVTPSSNLATLEKTTTVRGTLAGLDQATCEAFLDALLTSLALGTKTMSERSARFEKGTVVGSAVPATVFVGLDFNETYVSLLTGPEGVLDCDCDMEVQHSGNRLVEKPVPGGPSVIQGGDGLLGQACGRRTVSARCLCTTSASGEAWVRTIRTAFIAGPHEQPPSVRIARKFLPLAAGVPTGADANVQVFEVSARFEELLPETPFV